MSAGKKDARAIVHVIDTVDPLIYRQLRSQSGTVLLCGAKLWRSKTIRGTKHSSPVSTVRMDQSLVDHVEANRSFQRPCQTCKLLQPMQHADRLKWLEARALRFADIKTERADERAVMLAQIDAEIAKGQIDAIVCLDAWEHGDKTSLDRIVRCNNWIKLAPDHKQKCNLDRAHEGDCRAPSPGEPAHVHLEDVLALAIQAQKRAAGRFDRGVQLFVMRQRWECRGCDWWGYKTLVAEGHAGDGKFCPQCLLGCTSRQPPSQRDLVCRFCDGNASIIARDAEVGADHSERIEVRGHCVPCALRYLGKVEQTQHLHSHENEASP